MALVKDTNSYVTTAEADTYFADRLDADAYNNADAARKGQALVTATSVLDLQNWIGVAVTDSQALAWPRVGSYFDPKVGADIILEDNVIPNRVITATYELALHLLNNEGLLDNTGSVKSLVVGSIKLVGINTPGNISGVVKSYIRPLLQRGDSQYAWWRAN